MKNDKIVDSDNSAQPANQRHSLIKLFEFRHEVDSKWKAGCAILILVIIILGASIFFGFQSCNTLGHFIAISALFATAILLAVALRERSLLSPRWIILFYFLYMIGYFILN